MLPECGACRAIFSDEPARREIKILEPRIARTGRQALGACFRGALMQPVNTDVTAYQFVMFRHTWALKHWTYGDRYSLADYLREGRTPLMLPYLTKPASPNSSA